MQLTSRKCTWGRGEHWCCRASPYIYSVSKWYFSSLGMTDKTFQLARYVFMLRCFFTRWAERSLLLEIFLSDVHMQFFYTDYTVLTIVNLTFTLKAIPKRTKSDTGKFSHEGSSSGDDVDMTRQFTIYQSEPPLRKQPTARRKRAWKNCKYTNLDFSTLWLQ